MNSKFLFSLTWSIYKLVFANVPKIVLRYYFTNQALLLIFCVTNKQQHIIQNNYLSKTYLLEETFLKTKHIQTDGREHLKCKGLFKASGTRFWKISKLYKYFHCHQFNGLRDFFESNLKILKKKELWFICIDRILYRFYLLLLHISSTS